MCLCGWGRGRRRQGATGKRANRQLKEFSWDIWWLLSHTPETLAVLYFSLIIIARAPCLHSDVWINCLIHICIHTVISFLIICRMLFTCNRCPIYSLKCSSFLTPFWWSKYFSGFLRKGPCRITFEFVKVWKQFCCSLIFNGYLNWVDNSKFRIDSL